MSTEFDQDDAIDTTSQGTLILGTTGVPGSASIIRVDSDGNIITNPGSLAPIQHDQLSLLYEGAALTGVVYLLSAATLATLTLSYDGDNLTSVVRT